MSASLAVVCVVGLVTGVVAVVVLGLAAMLSNKALRVNVSRRGVDVRVAAVRVPGVGVTGAGG